MTKSGVDLIRAERLRQQSIEGWSASHDDTHTRNELARAAACYALHDCVVANRPRFPWGRQWWKPSVDPIRNLVKAGALIAAEIDRLQRRRESATKGDAVDPVDGIVAG